MRHLIVILAATLLAACNLDSLDLLDAEINDMIQEGRIALVECPDSLELAVHETGQCSAFNERGTLIKWSDIGVAKWESSNVNAVSIDVSGFVIAQNAADTVWIIARGTLDSRDSVQVFTY